MRLRLASRKSDLARWQAVKVARALEQLPEKPSIEFIFKSSLGDQNLDVPLAAMGAKGVFTEDFYADLIGGRCDLVVHSWKDLPIEERSDTHIALTLPRADVRDVLLVPETVWQKAIGQGRLEVLTSSPRRVYNLSRILPQLLPPSVTGAEMQVEFVNVRGNVPTRLRKMHSEGRALVLAKAGLDRLIEAEEEGFLDPDAAVKPLLADCRFQVFPVSVNPPAPAQGALAIEVVRDNEAVGALCASLMHEETYACVRRERETLRRYGGGCHQKIGAAVLARDFGRVIALRGVTDDGQVLEDWRIENDMPWVRARSVEAVFPHQASANAWFARMRVPMAIDPHAKQALFIARAEALPEGFVPEAWQKIWTAGVRTWTKLARAGVWVNGCQDGLGEQEPLLLDRLAGPLEWTKFSHAESDGVATYRLVARERLPDLRGKTHFFWLSRTSFELAFQNFPDEITSGYNACGPGVTCDFLKRQIQLKHPVKVFIGLEQFLRESLP